MKTINVALIGYKFMGRAHSNAWRQAASFFDVPVKPALKVIVGRDEAGVRDAAERFGWEEHSTSWEEVVRRADVDVVDICTPGDTHLPIALAAARAGKIVFCEKPLADNGYEHTFTHTVLDLLRAVAEGTQPKPDFEEGVRTQKILEAIERASTSRRWESV